MDDSDFRTVYRLLVAGLLFAIISNVLITWFLIEHHTYSFAGNIAATIVCGFSLWLVRKKWKAHLG